MKEEKSTWGGLEYLEEGAEGARGGVAFDILRSKSTLVHSSTAGAFHGDASPVSSLQSPAARFVSSRLFGQFAPRLLDKDGKEGVNGDFLTV